MGRPSIAGELRKRDAGTKLAEEMGAESFVGGGYEAGRIHCRDACKLCDPPAGKGDFYRGESQRAADLGGAGPGRKWRLMAAAQKGDAGGCLFRSP